MGDNFLKGLCVFVILTITSTIYFGVYIGTVDSVSDKCPTIPRKDTYKINKVITARWSWKYERGNYKVKGRCVSINHDADVFYKDKLVGRTDAKTLSITSETPIIDCTGKMLVLMKTGDAFETTINQNNIDVSYEFRSPNGTIIAYSDSKHFISDKIKIFDIEGRSIAKLERNKFSTTWKWKIEVSNQNHTMANPVILLAIAGKRSFSENKDKADACNIMFWLFFVIFLVCWLIIFICISCMLYDYCENRKKKPKKKIDPIVLTIKGDVSDSESY
uniref:Uncharacterized protein n=1 Tax=Pithovirus LCPAC401 TaxID=2506595 RepID=A0A481ZC52_9VIRU|nr:MAG: hypothetical protein LCPAC401_03380 [Pithovirus LCPAC401]